MNLPNGIPHKPHKKSLSTKFTLTCIVLIVSTALIIGVSLIFVAYNAEKVHIVEYQKNKADITAIVISDYIRNLQNKIEVFEQGSHLASLSSPDRKDALIDLLAHEKQSFSGFTFLSPEGTELEKISLYHTYLPDELKNQSANPEYYEAQKGEPYISPLYINPDSGLLSVHIALPVKDVQDHLVGILIADGNGIQLLKEIEKQRSDQGYAYIVNKSGNIIAHSETSDILTRYGDNISSLPPVSEFMTEGDSTSPPLSEYMGLSGELVIGSWSPVQGTDWSVIAELPSFIAFAGVNAMVRYLLILICSVIFLAVICGYLVSRSLVNPILSLTSTIEEIRDGSWDVEVAGVENPDEVGTLALAFSKMRDDLKKTYSDLEFQLKELSHIQQELRISEEQYRTLFEYNGNPLCLISEDMTIVLMNHMFEELWGYTKEEAEGILKWTAFIPDPGDLERMIEYHQKRRRPDADVPSTYEFLFKTRDNQLKNVIGTVNMMPGSNQSVAAIMDITGLRQAQNEILQKNQDLHLAYEELAENQEKLQEYIEALNANEKLLRESEQKYRSVVEDQTELICRYSKDGRTIFVNEAFCRYFGVTPKEVLNHVFIPEYYQSDHQRVVESIRSLSPKHPSRYMDHLLMINAEKRWLHVVYRGFFDPSGEVLYYQSVGYDITDRKNAEQALLHARKKLSLLNGVTFTDIQNYIFTLSGYLELHKDLITDSYQYTFIEKEQNVVQKITNSLIFAKDYQDMGIKPANWQSVLQTFLYAVSHLDLSSISREITITTLEIFADPLLEKVFFNLVSNVLHHGGSAASRIMLTSYESAEGLTIVFADNGNGIPEELKNSIFERRNGDKKGIGLFFVREILGITGISISETGAIGTGARFEIIVPKGKFRYPNL